MIRQTFTKEYNVELKPAQKRALSRTALATCKHILHHDMDDCKVVANDAGNGYVHATVFTVIYGIEIPKLKMLIGPKGKITTD